ncbi:hypothetical protein LSH36_190g01036 [Paralvinella palmiformis]|uniref:Fibronectin type-III domain-containing protein n=1 Tax=Paralvinella palmiformis TaxID=53620 RepID=A0AAD9N5G5_9ANNE|nr:hypothetical protein LSH36_190g01036 [Paralvinella palmiformis]
MALVLLCGLIYLFVVNVQCENLALRKPANQTGMWGGLSADRAVDGRYGSVSGDQRYCAHPDNRVNDNKPAECVRHTIDTPGTDCGESYPDIVPRGGNVTITCHIRGRFVHFRRVGGREEWLVTLCEVEVYGRKEIDCSRCPNNIPCNDVTGCSQCEAGKLLPDCVRDCPDMTYGLSCSSQCGKCRYNQICNKTNGYCPPNDGCQLWFDGQRCDVEVVVPKRTNEVIKLGQMTNNTIEVIWEQIKNVPSVDKDYYKYSVDYRNVGDSGYKTGLIVRHNASIWNSAIIDHLDYNTQYEIQVTPYRKMRDNKDTGSGYNPVIGKTKCGVPGFPILISVQSESSNTNTQNIRIQYEPVLNLNPRCDKVILSWIEYRLNGTQKWWKEDCDINNTTSIVSPPSGGTYEIRVTVYNNGGISSSSNVKQISIQEKIPGPHVIGIPVQQSENYHNEEVLDGENKIQPNSEGTTEYEDILGSSEFIPVGRDLPVEVGQRPYEELSTVTGDGYQNVMAAPYTELKQLSV